MTCRINIFGDLCLHGIDQNYRFPPELESALMGACNVVNLECPITTSATRRPLQGTNLKASPKAMHLVKKFNVVSLANNHIRDYMDVGCEDTVRALGEAGVAWFGLGRSQKEAIQPLYMERDGVKLAFVGATRYANSKRGTWGTASDGTSLLPRMIRKCRNEGRFTVVYLHAGYEYVPLPAPRERLLAQRCIRAGADLIIMAHPHVVQGVEIYRGKTIAYSLGNFLFSPKLMNEVSSIPGDDRLFRSFWLEVEIGLDYKYTIRFHGYRFNHLKWKCLSSKENELLLSEISENSVLFHPPFRYRDYWKAYYRQATAICGQNRKIREKFQNISRLPWIDRLRVLTDFNFQDLKNRVACLVPWLFE